MAPVVGGSRPRNLSHVGDGGKVDVPLLSPSCPPPHRFGAHSFLWRSVRRLAAHSLQALREIPASMRDGPKKRTKGGSTVRLSSDSLGPLLRGT